MAKSSAFDVLIENTLMELEGELESEVGSEYQVSPPITYYKWKVYTDDSPTGTWRLDREIPARRMDRVDVRKFEEERLRRLAPRVGPLASQVAIQRYKFNGKNFSRDDAVSCRVIDVATKKNLYLYSSSPTRHLLAAHPASIDRTRSGS